MLKRDTLPGEQNVYEMARALWGENSQITAAVEELSELSAVLCRYLNRKTESLDEVITELADAEIMLEQMRLYFPPALIDAEKDRKLARLKVRLDADYDEAMKDLEDGVVKL